MKESDIRKKELLDEMLQLTKQDIGTFFPNKDTYVEIPCPGCSETCFHQKFRKDEFQYVQCDNCRTLFVNPRPNFDQLKKFYCDGVSVKFISQKFLPPFLEARRVNIFRPQAKALFPLIKENKLNRIGDIGAGFGIFCEELRSLFPEKKIFCIEPEKLMADICRQKGFSVIEKSFEDFDTGIEKFDLLTAFQIIEQIYSPLIFFKKVHSFLNPGGYFLFTTLNIDGFDLQVLWDSSKSITPPHHINFLNPQSARILVEQAGLECVEITTPGKLDTDIVERRCVEDDLPVGRFWKLFFERVDAETKKAFQETLIKNKLSSHMWVLCKMPNK